MPATSDPERKGRGAHLQTIQELIRAAPVLREVPQMPLVSIVTPCLNGAQYLEATIQSVLAQDYPRLQYEVRDGGSTDGSLDILKRYEGRLRWTSEKDSGAADAINQGLQNAAGEIFTYLNADDILLPGAVSTAVHALHTDPEAAGVYGEAWWIDGKGSQLARYPVSDFVPKLLQSECFICQPASFVRADAFRNLGGLDPSLALTFDYEFWMRLTRLYRLKRIDTVLACSRMHSANKSLGRKREVFEETFQILQKNYGYIPFQWVYAYLSHLADRRDQFFEPLQPSIHRYLQSLPRGLVLNRSAMGRYLSEWIRVITWQGLRRRVVGARQI